jgi:hypothetical protein
MRLVALGLAAAVALLSTAPAALAEQIRLSCASSPTASPQYLIVDLSNSTVTIEGWGTYSAKITPREITWNGPGETFQRLTRETGLWETHEGDSMGAMQCKRSSDVLRP